MKNKIHKIAAITIVAIALIIICIIATHQTNATSNNNNHDPTNNPTNTNTPTPTTPQTTHNNNNKRNRPINNEQIIYLKGNTTTLTEKTNNIFYLSNAEKTPDPSKWHISYTGKDLTAITYIQLNFKNGEPLTLNTGNMSYSTTTNDNNPNWIVATPADWELDYIDNNTDNESNSYVITEEAGDIQFNLSGYYKGTSNSDLFVIPEYGLTGLTALLTCFAALGIIYAAKNKTNTRTNNAGTIQTKNI
ncbi:MAG: hypothetical protein LBQ98_04320 [Nitrososphaerota archaeon]|jgi:hypothetical protein|nr:hypothetical protein [Nitrososphaerota archaeon]